MDAVDAFRRNINGRLITEGQIRAIDIVIDCLGQMDDIQSLFPQKIRCFLCSVAAEDHKTVQAQLMVVLLHGLDLVKTVLIRNSHQFERLAGGADNSAALCQDTRKITGGQQTVIAVDQAFVAFFKAIDLDIRQGIEEPLDNTPHRGIQRLAVAAAGQHTYSFHKSPFDKIFPVLQKEYMMHKHCVHILHL